MLDLVSKRFGKLIVLESTQKRSNKYIMWKCRCDCGNIVEITTNHLRKGDTKSCGCLSSVGYNTTGKRSYHNHSGKTNTSREYNTWINMNKRCYNKNNINYENYGGRGIEICYRWRAQKWGGPIEAFLNFLQDMGERPIGTSIDRIDSNGNYESNNCKWATPKEQTLNRRK